MSASRRHVRSLLSPRRRLHSPHCGCSSSRSAAASSTRSACSTGAAPAGCSPRFGSSASSAGASCAAPPSATRGPAPLRRAGRPTLGERFLAGFRPTAVAAAAPMPAAPMPPMPPLPVAAIGAVVPAPPVPMVAPPPLLPPAGLAAAAAVAQPVHLAAYPPPLNGVAPPALLAAALQPAPVSPPAHSHSIHIAGQGHNVPVSGNTFVLSDQLASDASLSLLRSLPAPSPLESCPVPKGIRCADLGPSGKAPSTTAEFKAYLRSWWRDITRSIRHPELIYKYEAFIRVTEAIADKVDVRQVLGYFGACQDAVDRGWYSYEPPLYAPAHSEFVAGFLNSRAGGLPSQSRLKRPRFQRDADRTSTSSEDSTRSSASQAPSARCFLPRHQGLDHTRAECRSQHPESVADHPPARRQRSSPAVAGSA